MFCAMPGMLIACKFGKILPVISLNTSLVMSLFCKKYFEKMAERFTCAPLVQADIFFL